MDKITFEELYRQTGNYHGEHTLLRLVVLDGDPILMSMNSTTEEGVGIILSREQLVELGKALLRAWEIAGEKV